MIEGLVRHNTEMRVEKNFVDSHGKSEVVFAFCHLLGSVRLMPRLKRIKYERLYFPDKGTAGDYPNLAGTFARPIRWDRIEQQYDEMVKSTVAVKRSFSAIILLRERFNGRSMRDSTSSRTGTRPMTSSAMVVRANWPRIRTATAGRSRRSGRHREAPAPGPWRRRASRPGCPGCGSPVA